MDKKIIVLGAGVSGLSCAFALQCLGYSVQIIAKDHIGNNSKDPCFVSLYPAASIIPHSVEHPRLNNLFEQSQTMFNHFLKKGVVGISEHEHYELFSETTEFPGFLPLMKNVRTYEESTIRSCPIKSTSFSINEGFGYDCLFADWNLYFPFLVQKFFDLGGELIHKKVSHSELSSLNADVIINCTELGAPSLIGLNPKPLIYKGHLARIKNVPPLLSSQDKVISYNFTPGKKSYASQEGNALDLYCYSRPDGIVLGGSRYVGTLNDKGDWVGENLIEPTQEINGTRIPEQIISINSDLIKTSFGVDLSLFPEKSAFVGYRFLGNGKAELKLECSEHSNQFIIHNYGHGGAGVTLSWGCAIEVVNLLHSKLGKDLLHSDNLIKVMESHL